LDAAARARRQALAARLHAMTREVRERPNGYAFRYPADALLAAAEFVALERRCCPFFRFDLALEPDGGPLWLAVRGPAGAKAFLVAELGADLGIAGAG
jgi:hypothetical protein